MATLNTRTIAEMIKSGSNYLAWRNLGFENSQVDLQKTGGCSRFVSTENGFVYSTQNMKPSQKKGVLNIWNTRTSKMCECSSVRLNDVIVPADWSGAFIVTGWNTPLDDDGSTMTGANIPVLKPFVGSSEFLAKIRKEYEDSLTIYDLWADLR